MDYHETNRKRWNAGARTWARRADTRGIWRRAVTDPSATLEPQELAALGEVGGRNVCVLGSGDNQAVFALAGMGADVTSVDISENQLAIARDRAEELGLANIRFLRADVCDLGQLVDESFDIVFTGGHVSVWVSDLERYYAEAVRILKREGKFIVAEYHPFRRGWIDRKTELVREASYLDRGPFRREVGEDLFGPNDGRFEQYEFHWTVSDMVSKMMRAGCVLEHLDEYGDASQGWECTDLAGLPHGLLLVGRKR